MQFSLEIDSNRLMDLCGVLDANISLISELTGSVISRSGNVFKVDGGDESFTSDFIRFLASKSGDLSPFKIRLYFRQRRDEVNENLDFGIDGLTKVQLLYSRMILKYDLTFAIGVAGTGKTYLAVASAIKAMNLGIVERVVLVRPAVEAGEKLGFLPGDMNQKVDPYLRPLFDALLGFLGTEKLAKFMERQLIEVAPLAYMRGRTLNDAFIILDEAQNTTRSQMKMFLTRIGFGSKVVVTGDLSQVDLGRGIKSGLREALELLSNVEGIGVVNFSASDVLRHPLVQRIIDAYSTLDDNSR